MRLLGELDQQRQRQQQQQHGECCCCCRRLGLHCWLQHRWESTGSSQSCHDQQGYSGEGDWKHSAAGLLLLLLLLLQTAC
jgi:hypothetical protein